MGILNRKSSSASGTLMYKNGGKKKDKLSKKHKVVKIDAASDTGSNIQIDDVAAAGFDRKVVTKSGANVYIPKGESLKENKQRIRRTNRLGRKVKRQKGTAKDVMSYKF